MYQGIRVGDKMTFQDMFRLDFILIDNTHGQYIYSDGKMYVTTVNEHVTGIIPQHIDGDIEIRG